MIGLFIHFSYRIHQVRLHLILLKLLRYCVSNYLTSLRLNLNRCASKIHVYMTPYMIVVSFALLYFLYKFSSTVTHVHLLFPEAFYRISQNFQEPDPVHELANADPFDPEVQRKIEELIHESNINREMEAAVENYPETFGQVTMLYVACKVNGYSVKAFVDSGAQITLMSLECARRCNLERLIDKRFQGMAYGVGSQKIIGRIHQAMLKFDNTALPVRLLLYSQPPL